MYMHIGEFIDYGHISDFAMLEIFFFIFPLTYTTMRILFYCAIMDCAIIGM